MADTVLQTEIPATSPDQTMPQHRHWRTFFPSYGTDNHVLQKIIESYETCPMRLEALELKIDEPPNLSTRQEFTDLQSFADFLDQRSTSDVAALRTITVRSLSQGLIKLLGAYFHMEHDLWTSRKVACDREYFAAPLNEKGATKFFHFHLACVNFYHTTDKTPPEWRKSRKIDHCTRLFTLLDSRSATRDHTDENMKVMVIRRITGHLRQDGNRWTFLYLCDPIDGFEHANYARDFEFDSLSNSEDWVSGCVAEGMNKVYAADLCKDGFGLVAKILRDIKSSWKLLLTQCETFLEEANENFEDQDFIDAANFFHREYLLSLDYFQRQRFYHERCVTYLTSTATRGEMNILPTVFRQDFVQELNALKVVGLRLNALRLRTTTVLDMILSLNSIRQTEIQRQDAKTALAQGESLRKLTLINMAFLPPSFAATVFGMNTRQTYNLQIWVFVVTALILCLITVALLMLRAVRQTSYDVGAGSSTTREPSGSHTGSFRRLIRHSKNVAYGTSEIKDPEQGKATSHDM